MALEPESAFDIEMKEMDAPAPSVFEPLYKMIGDKKIPVSKREGVIWEYRLQQAKKKSEDICNDWEKYIRIYRNYDRPSGDMDDKRLRLNEKDRTYENLLWANINGLNRETIMKLPRLEFTGSNEFESQIGGIFETAINKYMSKTGNVGLNMKEKLSKVDIATQITNRGILRLDWNDSAQEGIVREAIAECERELVEATDTDKIRDIEGKLYALNEKLQASGFSGAQVTIVQPDKLFIDPNSQLESGLDADWMIEERTMLESIIKAKYCDNEGESVFANEKLDSEDKDSDYVLGDEEDEVNCDHERTVTVYYIWDKLKKRVYLYQKGKWKYPLWVWNDPYNLKQFFPYFILNYNSDPFESISDPECSYYLPLQAEINKINSQIATARDRAFNIVLYDDQADIESKDLQNLTAGKEGFVSIRVPQGKDINKVFTPIPTPALDNTGLLNKSDLYAQIGKLSSADNLTRGEEYRTNTTNMAIEQYSGAKKVIIGIRIDRLIAFYRRIAEEILRLMLNRLTEQEWIDLVGAEEATFLSQNVFDYDSLNLKIAGDDTIEPTAAMKKQEAMQLAQVLGQFAGAVPATGIVVLKMLSRAFNDIVLTNEDWSMIFQSIQQQQPAPEQQPVQPLPSPEQLVTEAAI